LNDPMAWNASGATPVVLHMRSVDVELSDVVASSAIRQRPHDHDRPFLCCVVSGSYEESIGGRRRRHPPATVLLHARDTRHADALAAGGRLFGVTLGPAWDERVARLGAFDGVLVDASARAAALLAAVRREARSGLPAADLAVEGLLLEVLAAVARTPEPCDAAVGRAAEFLRAHLGRPLQLAELARAAGADADAGALARRFRRTHGVGPMAYLQRMRVLEAQRLMATGVPLVDVAAACGFADQSHLTRVFRRVTGTTPGAWRSSAR
jgi:AraC family transcriptional regulator